MRISFVTENTIDVASDINDSLVEADGIIPMKVETIDEIPPIGSAVQNKYYANEDYVCTLDPTGQFYIKSYPTIILFENKLYVVQNGNWEKVLGNFVAKTGDETIAGIKTFSSSPIVPTPTAGTQAVNKDYVDGLDSKNLKQSANLSDLANTATARTNLGLGTSATRNVGLDNGNVMLVGEFGLGRRNTENGAIWNELDKRSGFFRIPAYADNNPFGDISGASISWSGYGGGGHLDRIIKIWTGESYYFQHFDGTKWGNLREIFHTGNIQSTTGQSTKYPMTQKAVTDAINGISDKRDKAEINEIGLGLEIIENLKTFSFKLNKRDWYRQEAAKELVEVEEDGEVKVQEKINDDVLNLPLSDFEENDGHLKREDVYTGFIAQDLKETLEDLGFGHFGIVKNYSEEYEGGEDRYYIEHLALLPFLVNSIKQLNNRVKELEDAAK